MKCRNCPRDATYMMPEVVQNFGRLGGLLINSWVAFCESCLLLVD